MLLGRVPRGSILERSRYEFFVRTQLDGAFMVTPQELEAIVGPKAKDAAAIIAQLEAGEEGKINALSVLCGAVAVCHGELMAHWLGAIEGGEGAAAAAAGARRAVRRGDPGRRRRGRRSGAAARLWEG